MQGVVFEIHGGRGVAEDGRSGGILFKSLADKKISTLTTVKGN